MKKLLSEFAARLPLIRRRVVPLVTVIRLDGAIMPGRGQFGSEPLNIETLAPVIAAAFRPKRLSAVALVINCPGGSPVQSALIAKRIRDLADERSVKVYAFVEDAAVSGGYWLATAADEIYANPSSMVGSIGVIYAAFGFEEVMAKIGVARRVHTAGTRKAMLDPFQPEQDDDVDKLKSLQAEIHRQFIDQVKSRRGTRLDDGRSEELFSGDVFLGDQGKELGLVDAMGDLYGTMRQKLGKKVRLVRIGGHRSIFRRFSGVSGGDPVARALHAIEQRLYWYRIGL